MNYIDYRARVTDYTQKSLAQLRSNDPEEDRIRGLYPQARYRHPHPVYYLMESLIAFGLSNDAEEVLLKPDEKEVGVYFKRDDEWQKILALPKALQRAVTDRFKDSGEMEINQTGQTQSGFFHVVSQGKKFHMPLTVTPSSHGETIAFHFQLQKD
jgi:type II secretory ATPase GspE/PulE/Tfp pilus assembly ATPase PilB-like protein